MNGFSGGRLPPKSQIAEIRFRFDPYSAENHESGFPRVDIRTRPGNGNWRNSAGFTFRDESLNARNAFAPSKGAEQARRYQWSIDGPIVKGRTSFSLNVGGLESVRQPDHPRPIRRPARSYAAWSPSRTIASTSMRASSTRSRRTSMLRARVRAQQQHAGEPRRRPASISTTRAYARERSNTRFRSANSGSFGRKLRNEAALRARLGRLLVHVAERRGHGPRAGRVQRAAARSVRGGRTLERDRVRRQPRLHARQEARAAHRRPRRGRLVSRRRGAQLPRHLHLQRRLDAFDAAAAAAVLAARGQSAGRVSHRQFGAYIRTTSACART